MSINLARIGFVLLLGALILMAVVRPEVSKVTPAQTVATATLINDTLFDGYTNFADAILEDGSEMEIQVDRPTRAGSQAAYWILDETGEPLRSEILWQIENTAATHVVDAMSTAIAVLSVAALMASGIVHLVTHRRRAPPLSA